MLLTDEEISDARNGTRDVIGDINGRIREAEDELYQAQIATVPRTRFESAAE